MMAETECQVRIEEIVVGERTRRDLGDVDGLATSIKEGGLSPVPNSVLSPCGGRTSVVSYVQVGGSPPSLPLPPAGQSASQSTEVTLKELVSLELPHSPQGDAPWTTGKIRPLPGTPG